VLDVRGTSDHDRTRKPSSDRFLFTE